MLILLIEIFDNIDNKYINDDRNLKFYRVFLT